jgi:hypothetical protein
MWLNGAASQPCFHFFNVKLVWSQYESLAEAMGGTCATVLGSSFGISHEIVLVVTRFPILLD